MNEKVNILDVVRGTTVDGPGFRTSIYFAGCRHECPGCHNPQSWDFSAGTPMSVSELMDIIREEEFDVTFSGGDPLYSPVFATELAREIRKDGYGLWIYTGFRFEEIYCRPEFTELLGLADVLVDSPFVLSERDTDLLFKGSSNQRLINLPESLKTGEIVEWQR